MRTNEFIDFIVERENIRIRRANGYPKPWTQNEILQNYRFCNIRREDDKVTQWIAKNWRDPNQGEPEILFAMAVARYINHIETLEDIGFPLETRNPLTRITHVLRNRTKEKKKVFNTAYMITTHSVKMPKVDYLVERIFKPLKGDGIILRPGPSFRTFQDLHAELSSRPGIGSFMSGQIIADIKYCQPWYQSCSDFNTFVAMGPGSKRGLNRVMSRSIDKSWKVEEFRGILWELQKKVNDHLKELGWVILHAQDIQNCLCEYDKFERLCLDQGQVKSRYNGRGD